MRNSSGSAKQYFFGQSPAANIPRCRLRRPSTHKTTINADYIYPLFWDEVLPADTFKLDVSCVARLTTMLAPIMDNLYLDWHFFFVPSRLVWKDWQRLMGEREDPDQSIDISMPYVTCPDGGIAAGSIGDYMGLPIGVKWNNHDVQALPLRAYQLIWDTWYRDENLQDSIKPKLDDTIQSISAFSLLKRGKRKDYFTSALPTPQKSLNPIMLPIGQRADVYGDGKNIGLTDGTTKVTLADRAAGAANAHLAALSVDGYGQAVGTGRGDTFLISGKAVGVVPKSNTDTPNYSGMYADLSSAEGVSIDDVRIAFALQRLLERDQLGTRYIELLKAQFGVISPDARLQRPEFLGSFTVPVNVHAVTQTSESGTTPQGTLTGVGTINSVNRVFTKSFVEHGYILGLCSVRADLSYQQGLSRKWSRSTRYDFYWPPLAHIGEQGILNKEIYLSGDATQDNGVFGYAERWSEYKFGENRISGQLRSTYAQSLDFWHLAQNFESLPTLNSNFIEENVPLDRVLALDSATAPQFIVDTLFDLTCVRPMPLYDVPGLRVL